ncbi:MAG: glycosyltransferase family 39 protein [Pseudomonadota bacterium]
MLAANENMQGHQEPDSVWWRRTLQVVGLILLLRLISLWFNSTELFFDEAQYWDWGKEPAFGYFSKPPMLGWIIGLFTSVCGDGEFCVRLASPILHTCTALLLYKIAERMFDPRTAFWSALLYITLPAVTLSSTLISTDVPLLFFWSLALLALLRLESDDQLSDAVLLGIALGAGLMSKYAMIYFVPCTILYCLLVPERPHLLMRRNFWIAMLVAFICVLPNIIWNMQNQFITASHTGENIGWGSGFPHFKAFAEFFFSQFGVFGPITFGIFLAAAVRLPVEGMTRAQRFLLCFSVPVIAIICFQALMSKAYANWAAVTYIAATVLVADLMVNTIPEFWRRLTLPIHLGVFAVIAIAVMFSRPGQIPLPEDIRPFDRMQGAREISEEAANRISAGDYAVILTDDRRLSALMNYYLRDFDIPKRAWQSRDVPRDHFELVRPYKADPISPVFFITDNHNPARIIGNFADAELLGQVDPSAGETDSVWYYALKGYGSVAADDNTNSQ